MDLDLNPADFCFYGGFGFNNFCFTGFGFGDFVLNFFATFSSVSGLLMIFVKFGSTEILASVEIVHRVGLHLSLDQ